MSKKMSAQFLKDSQIVERHSIMMHAHNRARRMINAIDAPYKTEFVSSRGRKLKYRELPEEERRDSRTQSIPFTKKRRKLPGKRVWKNRTIDFSAVEANMTLNEFNSRQKANPAMQRMFKERHGNVNIMQ